MKNQILISVLIFLLFNCKKQEFEEFDVSYGNTFETDFSIQFSSENDSVFIREHWSANDLKAPLSRKNYVSKLSDLQKTELDSFIKNTDFKIADTLYFEDYSDGEYFSLYIKKDGLAKKINIHSRSAPKSLLNFADWIYKTKKSLNFIETQREFKFKSKSTELEPPKTP